MTEWGNALLEGSRGSHVGSLGCSGCALLKRDLRASRVARDQAQATKQITSVLSADFPVAESNCPSNPENV